MYGGKGYEVRAGVQTLFSARHNISIAGPPWRAATGNFAAVAEVAKTPPFAK